MVLAEAKAKQWKKKRHFTSQVSTPCPALPCPALHVLTVLLYTHSAQDLRFVEANKELRDKVMALRAESGVVTAKHRNQAHQNKVIFNMLSSKEQQRVLKRRQARKTAERNRLDRLHWMHVASFHNWPVGEVRTPPHPSSGLYCLYCLDCLYSLLSLYSLISPLF